MDEKSVNIVALEGYEIDKEKSTFEKIVFKKKDMHVKFYTDVARKLFYNKITNYIQGNGMIDDFICKDSELISCPNNCTSKKQAEKLLAFNKLMNVAKYLNGDWCSNDINSNIEKHYFWLDNGCSELKIYSVTSSGGGLGLIYFKSEELTQKAIEILGEETIKLALSTDW